MSYKEFYRSQIEKRQRGESTLLGLSSSIEGLDKLMGGFAPNELTVIGSRAIIGKTTFAIYAALKAASSGKKVLFFNLEHTSESIADKAGRLLDTWKANQSAKDNFIIKEGPSVSVEEISDLIEKQRESTGLDVVFIDSLFWIKGREEERSIYERFTGVVTDLKIVSKLLNIPVVVTAELKRIESKVHKTVAQRPAMEQFRGSGCIEQVADNIILLHRPDFYDECDQPGVTELIVAKARGGERGIVRVMFDYNSKLFNELIDFEKTELATVR